MFSSETRPRRLGLWLALIAIALIVLAVVLYQRGRAAVDDLDAQIALLQRADDSSETLYEWAGDDAWAEAAALRGFALPADATSVRLARQGRLRPTYWLRFQLPRAGLDAFLASTCVGQLQANGRPTFRYGSDPDVIANLPWWQPETVALVAGGDCTDDTGVRYGLVAGLGATVTLYMEIAPPR